jgi:hypothetical protein
MNALILNLFLRRPPKVVLVFLDLLVLLVRFLRLIHPRLCWVLLVSLADLAPPNELPLTRINRLTLSRRRHHQSPDVVPVINHGLMVHAVVFRTRAIGEEFRTLILPHQRVVERDIVDEHINPRRFILQVPTMNHLDQPTDILLRKFVNHLDEGSCLLPFWYTDFQI